ncbi:MAG TPA: PrsW family intramembrane metalloprotease [Actinomycetota bacterium]|nr:PrsW family intramembrane metalloprotease [Actinomycetota bacterium]
MGILRAPAFLITYAVIQTLVLLLLIRFLDLYEHEPFSLVAIMALWGAVGATALSAIGNGMVAASLSRDVDAVFGPAISAPVVEELAKGIALIIAFGVTAWAHSRFGMMQMGGITDGIVYGAAVGLGFAFTEDLHYLLVVAAQQGLDQGLSLFLLRRDFLGMGALQHAIFTAAFGAGLGLATWSRRIGWRSLWAVLGLLVAVLLHATNNGLVQLVLVMRYGFDETAAALGQLGTLTPQMEATRATVLNAMAILDFVIVAAFITAIVLWLRHQRRIIRFELAKEADLGLIDPRDWELVPSYWRRVQWYWQLLRVGEIERVRVIRRLHTELAGLAFLRWRLGADSGRPEISKSRQKVANLKAQGAVDVYAPQ